MFMQLLNMTIDLSESHGIFFYQNMVPQNIFLSFFDHKKGSGDSKSTFAVVLGSLDNAFALDHDTGELNYLNEAT